MNRRKKSSSGKFVSEPGRLILSILIVILLIATVFFLLEKTKNQDQHVDEGNNVAQQRHEITQPQSPQYVQGIYTSGHNQKPTVKSKLSRVGSIAIIVDDMGASMKDANRLLAINLPITFSVIPGLANSRGVAEAAHARGQEVMIHMPMEPHGYPAQRIESNGLLLSLTDEEITERVSGYLNEVPHADGANNHMGSSFTEHENKMIPVLDVLKKRGLFFIDSRTSSRSVGYTLAIGMGLKAANRNVFLDNDQSVEKVKDQLRTAVKIAERHGSAIAICHPHPGTIDALEEMMPEIQREGIEFVSAASLVR